MTTDINTTTSSADLLESVRETAKAIRRSPNTRYSRLLENLLRTFDLHFDHGLTWAQHYTARVHVYVCPDDTCKTYIAASDYHYNRHRAYFRYPEQHARAGTGRGEAYFVLVVKTCRWLKAKRPAEFAAYKAAWAAVEAEGMLNALAELEHQRDSGEALRAAGKAFGYTAAYTVDAAIGDAVRARGLEAVLNAIGAAANVESLLAALTALITASTAEAA